MKWSKEINKVGSCWNTSRFFPRHRSLATDGYVRDTAVVIHEMSLSNMDEGIGKCPICGSGVVDLDNMETTFHYAEYGTATTPNKDMYVETDCHCMNCGNDRQVFGRVNTGEAVMVYHTRR